MVGALHELPATELARRMRCGQLSPVALAEHFLARIDALNPRLQAFNLVLAERALDEARAAEAMLRAGRVLSPLHGVPYALKDLYDVAGLPTTAGSRLLADNLAEEDSAAAARLAQAGLVLLGKTITVEFAHGGVGINHSQATPHNPWHREAHVPGGSSAGSAVAVAAGLAPLALGSDTGGSVRIPASLCGIVGLKTTVGRISRHGVYPLSWTLDSVGPLTRSVEDAATTLGLLQGPDPRDESTVGVAPLDPMARIDDGLAGLRIALVERPFFEGLDVEVEAAVREAVRVFERLGARIAVVDMPEAVLSDPPSGVISGVEACAVNSRFLERLDEVDPVVAERMRTNIDRPAREYLLAVREMHRLRRSVLHTLRHVDLLLVPTTCHAARPVAEADADMDAYLRHVQWYRRNVVVGNVLDLCGVSVPCGLTREGLPIGLLVYAKPFAEDLALQAARAYEHATAWCREVPDLSWAQAAGADAGS